MKSALIVGLLLVPGVIHLLPVVGVVGGERLAQLYGVDVRDPTLVLALRHRALLFALVAAALFVAAFHAAWRTPAVVAGLVSAGGFLILAWIAGDVSPAMRRVVIADVVAVLCLLAAGGLHIFGGNPHG